MGYYNYRSRSHYAPKPRQPVEDFENRWLSISSEPGLSDWESSFIDSVKQEYSKSGGLTDKQIRTFQKIEKAHSPQAKADEANWAVDYRSKYQSDAKILIEHYSLQETSFYWHNIIDRCKAGEVPPKGPFLKMHGNKFSQSVINGHKSESKFKQGSVVQIRSTYDSRSFRNVLCMVIKTDLVPVRYAKAGTKRYVLLPFGSQKTIRLDESSIMKRNKNGKAYGR